MASQSLELSRQTQAGKTPLKWQERFYIKRIGEEDIEISLVERDEILQSLASGDKFIQIGKYTLMVNSIKSIDPKYGKYNIPPCPKEELGYKQGENGNMLSYVSNKSEIDEWHKCFGNQLAEAWQKK
jgi:hypothetical protein